MDRKGVRLWVWVGMLSLIPFMLGLAFLSFLFVGSMGGASLANINCSQPNSNQGGVVVAPNGVSLNSGGLTVKGSPMNKSQAIIASKIAGVIDARSGSDFPARFRERLVIIMLIQGTVESTLQNLDHGDRDSLGVFQERPSQGWGTPAQILDVSYSTNRMLDANLKVPGWQTYPYGIVAQKAELSGYPYRYQVWINEAKRTYAQMHFKGGGQGPSQSVSSDLSCVSSQSDTSLVEHAIEFAKSRIGEPYVWGGHEPGGFDCSGLMQWAFGKAGLTLPRDSRSQWAYRGDNAKGITTSHVSRGDLQRGDLVFWSHNGTGSGVYHVGLYLGNDQMVNAANPRSDILVQTMYYSGGFLGGLRLHQADGASFGGAWQSPLKRGTYSQTGSAGQYGPRIHPVTGAYGFHNGVDLAAPTGTPIYAAHNGKVVRAGYDSCWGNYLVIDVGNDIALLYPHESAYAPGIHVGSVVKAGQRVGSVGGTGCVTGPHLHLSVCTNIGLCLRGSGANGAGSVNPLRFFQSKGVRLF